MEAVLDIVDLETRFETDQGSARVVDKVSMSLRKGEIVGLVGESGSGKSVTGLSVMRLVPKPGRIAGGKIRFKGADLLDLGSAEMRAIRGKGIAMIFQDPMSTLNPVLTIGRQMKEAILAHENVSSRGAREKSIELLNRVGIPQPESRLSAYPHQFSGGMRQRVAIAIALLHRPDVIIADEPTTALDVTIQGQILSKMQDLVAEAGTALLWVTHDLGLASGFADRIIVMYAGRIVEEGPTDTILSSPAHPYTAGLLQSIPGRSRRGELLKPIPGSAPSQYERPPGCAFRPRCARGTSLCETEPPMVSLGPGRNALCFHPLDSGPLQ
jgi:peptide/nickel transport system ATP-binding protein